MGEKSGNFYKIQGHLLRLLQTQGNPILLIKAIGRFELQQSFTQNIRQM